ncbi:MAG: hypothetical protein QM703_11280 [Gemmatales bacterium]
MHFKAQMTVVLNEPIEVEGDQKGEDVIGYIIMFGINAPDLASAAKYAHDVALRPKQPDGTFREFSGVVDQAEIQRIEKSHWEDFILQNAKRIDQEGVYYSTGLIFFSADEKE